MSSNIRSDRYAAFLATMRARDREMEAAFRAHIKEKFKGCNPFPRVAEAKELPTHANCRCSVVWGREGTEEATSNE